jgi:hypothetical protein
VAPQDAAAAQPSTRLLVICDTSEHATWLSPEECSAVGVSLALLTPAENGEVRARVFLPARGSWATEHIAISSSIEALNLSAFRQAIEQCEPDACLVLGDGTLSRLVWMLADLLLLPVFGLISTHAQLVNLGRREKPRPDLFFIANGDLLPAALADERYGTTLLPTGHPGKDLRPDGPSAEEARRQVLQAIQRWTRHQITDLKPDLSIVVPAYRESQNVPLVCGRLLEAIANGSVETEILVVDDASPDDTYRVAIAQMWRSPRIRALTKRVPRGMGFAIRHGVMQSRAPIVAITMGDGSDEVGEIPAMFRKVRDEGYALVIGSRYRRRENYEAIPRLYRFWSAVFRWTTAILIGLRLRDYTNAFRVFRKSIFEKRGFEGRGFEISPEITFKAWFATRKVAEHDVRHLKRSAGQSTFSFLRAGPGYALMLLKALICRVTGRWFVLEW